MVEHHPRRKRQTLGLGTRRGGNRPCGNRQIGCMKPARRAEIALVNLCLRHTIGIDEVRNAIWQADFGGPGRAFHRGAQQPWLDIATALGQCLFQRRKGMVFGQTLSEISQHFSQIARKIIERHPARAIPLECIGGPLVGPRCASDAEVNAVRRHCRQQLERLGNLER